MSKFIKQSQLPSMLKEGASVQDDPLIKNIQACKEMAQVTKSSFGPYGLNKMVINHLGKLFVTHDAAVILRELEVQHPAANLLVMASKSMEEEVGDGSNFTIMLAGELLSHAELLKKKGLKATEIMRGYEVAKKKALELLKENIVGKVVDHRDIAEVQAALTSSIASKQYGYEELLSKLVSDACINVTQKNSKNFNVDNVRIMKIAGGSIHDSALIRGFCIQRGTEGSVCCCVLAPPLSYLTAPHHLNLPFSLIQIQSVKGAKVAVYNCAIDAAATETKGNVLIENADELLNFSEVCCFATPRDTRCPPSLTRNTHTHTHRARKSALRRL